MLLRLGSPLLGVSRAALVSAREMMSSWRSELWAAAAPGLIHLRTSYVLQDKKGTRLPATFETNGYRVSPTSAIVPLEAVEPWTFDPEIAAALKTKEVSLVQDDFDIEVWMSMEGRSLALRSLKRSSGEVRISRKRSPPRDTVFVLNAAGSPVKVSVARRASVDNVAYLEFKKDKADGFKPSFANGATSRGATFRITNDRTPGLVFLDVVAAAGAEVIDLVDPIDSSALGSPFFARDGLAALVVDERHAIPVGPILKSLRIEVLPTK
jgi:hypothetical protein